jgi:hypothetical protein
VKPEVVSSAGEEVMRKSIKILVTAIIFITSSTFISHVLAVGVKDRGIHISTSNKSDACYFLHDVSFDSNGYVVLSFSWESYCHNDGKKEVYFVETSPKKKIRGVIGIKGTSAGNAFAIVVEPDVGRVAIEMGGYQGELAQRYFDVQKYIDVARRQTSDWQTAWRRSEQGLQETAKKDDDPPKIVLLSPDVTPNRTVFRVDTYQTFIRGKATDNTGIGSVLVNGEKARVREDGSFAKKVRLALGTNKMSVQADDIHGNTSERAFAIIREEFIPDDTLADVDIPPQRNMSNPEGIGVVIGIESYQYVPAATYAYNDAEVVREYLAETLGFRKDRLKLITNTRATKAEFDRLLGSNGWLARNVVRGKSDVVVYFSGHGIPDPKTKRLGLLPFDVDPNYSVGMPLDALYNTLATLKARTVTVLLDACFSGQSREKKMLLADARGITIVPKYERLPAGITAIVAATGGQISGPVKDKEHGLFTYHLLKGLGGSADQNKDRQITLGELAAYTSREVKNHANRLGWEQTPELLGDGKRTWVRW